MFAMGQAIAVRQDFTAAELRRLATRTKDVAQARRLLAIAAILDGAPRAEAARIGGMDRQTLRDWVIRFNEQGPEGLINMVSPGSPPKLDEEHRAFLARVVEEGPIPAVHGVVRWRGCDLIVLLYEEFGIEVSDDTVYRALKRLGFAHLSPRPRAYKQDVEAMEAFKKRARIGGPPVAVETDCAIVDARGAAEKFLVDLTPQKNVVHGLLRTCEW
jgi:transposase